MPHKTKKKEKKKKTKRRDKKKFKKLKERFDMLKKRFKEYDVMINDSNEYDILLNNQLNNLENLTPEMIKRKEMTSEEIVKRKMKVKDDMEKNYNKKRILIRNRDNIIEQIMEGNPRRGTPSDESEPESATIKQSSLPESATGKQPSDYASAIDRFTQEVKEFTQELETEVVPSQQLSEDTEETRVFSDKEWSRGTDSSCPQTPVPEINDDVRKEIQDIVGEEINNQGNRKRLTRLIKLLTVCGNAIKISGRICIGAVGGLYSFFQAVHNAPIPGANILAYLLIILFACSPPAQLTLNYVIVPIFQTLIRLCSLFSDTSIASIINEYFLQPGISNLKGASEYAVDIVNIIFEKITGSGMYINAAEWLRDTLINLFTSVFQKIMDSGEFQTAVAAALATATAASAGAGAAAGAAATGAATGAATTIGGMVVDTIVRTFPTLVSAGVQYTLANGGTNLLTLGAGRKYTRKLKRKNQTKRIPL